VTKELRALTLLAALAAVIIGFGVRPPISAVAAFSREPCLCSIQRVGVRWGAQLRGGSILRCFRPHVGVL
jgi:hypothetical protein